MYMQLRHVVDLRPSFQLHLNQSAELTPTALALKLVYARSVSTHVTQQLVESMPSAEKGTKPLLVSAYPVFKAILTLNASMSAQSTQTARPTRLASTTSVETHVRVCAVPTPPAR